MPREIELTVYAFSDLSLKSQENAVAEMHDILVDDFWFVPTKQDAENVGLNIQSFDTDRRWEIDISFSSDSEDTANMILESHGDMCDTYEEAKKFMAEFTPLNEELIELEEAIENYENAGYPLAPDEEQGLEKCYEEQENKEEQVKELEKDFLHSLGQIYLIMLRNEWEDLFNEDRIYAYLMDSDYEFYENGKPYFPYD